jgi:hypothetical protein
LQESEKANFFSLGAGIRHLIRLFDLLHKYDNYSPHRLRKIQSQLRAIDPHHTIFYPVLQPESGKCAIDRF